MVSELQQSEGHVWLRSKPKRSTTLATIQVMNPFFPFFNVIGGSTSGMVSPLPEPNNLNYFLTTKLSDNFLLWESQFIPLLKSYNLIGFIDGSLPCPEKFVVSESNQEPKINPAYI
jgi:hypothetical protein